ncbi:MAG: FlgD immunoglobulin-like domain containing protein [Fidelibacterota bacterium]
MKRNIITFFTIIFLMICFYNMSLIAQTHTTWNVKHVSQLSNYISYTIAVQNDIVAFQASGDVSLLKMMEISNPENPVDLSQIDAPFDKIVLKDTLAFLLGYHIDIINISNPSNPAKLGHYLAENRPCAIDLNDDNYAFIGSYSTNDGSNAIEIADFNDPANPLDGRSTTFFADPAAITFQDPYFYVADQAGLRVLYNSLSLTEVRLFPTRDMALDLVIQDNLAYIATRDGLQIVDISEVYSMQEIGFFATSIRMESIALQDSFIYATCQEEGVKVINVSDPAQPKEVGYYAPDNCKIVDVAAYGNYICISDRNLGVSLLENQVYQPDMSLRIPDSESFPNTIVSIPILNDSTVTDVGDIQFTLSFNNDLLSYRGVRKNRIAESDTIQSGTVTSISYRLNSSPLDLSVGDTLDVLEFYVNPNAVEGQTSGIQFTGPVYVYDSQAYQFSCVYQNGVFTTTPAPTIIFDKADSSVFLEDDSLVISIQYKHFSSFRGDSVEIRLVACPPYLGSNEDITRLSGRPGNRYVGLDSLRVLACDSVYGDTISAKLSYNIINTPSEITSAPVHVVYEQHEYEYDVNSPDEGEGLVYHLTGPDFLSIDSLSGLIRGLPETDDIGSHEMLIFADDGNGSVDEQHFILNVLYFNPATKPPVTKAFPDIEFPEDSSIIAFDLDSLVYDADTPDSLLLWFISFNGMQSFLSSKQDFSVEELEDKGSSSGIDISIDPDSHIVTMKGNENWNGTQDLVFLVTDGDNIAMEHCLVTVLPVNDAPQAFQLLSPVQGDTCQSNQYVWEKSVDVDKNDYVTYTVQISNFFDFRNILHSESVSDTSTVIQNTGTGQLYWKVTARDLAGAETEAGPEPFVVMPVSIVSTPRHFSLEQNYPNPFNPVTEIKYAIPEVSHGSLLIYDVAGRIIREWDITGQAPGRHSVTWDGTDMNGNPVSSGVYLYTLKTVSFSDTKKLIFLK